MAGYIVHDQIGEGNYGETEREIQKLIAERDQILGLQPAADADIDGFRSPERHLRQFDEPRNLLWFRTERISREWNTKHRWQPDAYGSHDHGSSINCILAAAGILITSTRQTTLRARPSFINIRQARSISSLRPRRARPLKFCRTENPVTGAAAGSDVQNGKVFVKESRLYNLINNPDGSGTHTLELIIDSPGLEAFTFTFG